MVLYRDFPPGLDPAGTWAVEGFLSLDTVNILSQGAQNANIGIIDMAEFGNTGAVEFYTGMRNDGAPYSIGFESSINRFNVRRYSPSSGARARAARSHHGPSSRSPSRVPALCRSAELVLDELYVQQLQRRLRRLRPHRARRAEEHLDVLLQVQLRRPVDQAAHHCH